jgi:opacity protein-like surface antigen
VYIPGLSQTKQFTFTNIDVPVLLGFRWKLFHAMAGPVASYTLKTDTELNDLINMVTQKYVGTTAEIASKTSFSYQVGGGIDLLGFTLDVRYEGNLSQLTKTLPIPTGITFSPKLNLYQVTLGYKIF